MPSAATAISSTERFASRAEHLALAAAIGAYGQHERAQIAPRRLDLVDDREDLVAGEDRSRPR